MPRLPRASRYWTQLPRLSCTWHACEGGSAPKPSGKRRDTLARASSQGYVTYKAKGRAGGLCRVEQEAWEGYNPHRGSGES
eukprot:5911153-Pleurochrysis_carterae.AAC.7